MKIPASPPIFNKDSLAEEVFSTYLKSQTYIDEMNRRYVPWDKFIYMDSPSWVSKEVLWQAMKFGRLHNQMEVKIGKHTFTFNVTDKIHKLMHYFDMNSGWHIWSDDIIPNGKKDYYLANSIMEETIHSSILEGAGTTRSEAKKMITSKRKPRSKGERMIVNNYETIKYLKSLNQKKLTPELIFEIHKRITHNTLEDSTKEGMFRTDNKTVVEDKITRKVYWNPPDFAEIPWFITEMCDFINEDHESWKTTFIHPLIKAMLLHFWIGYLHPFVDGNGRTARALFYRYVLSKNYRLIEYISISRVFVQAPAKYARAYLRSEKDTNDTTYFLHYHLTAIKLGMDELIAYINREQMSSSKVLQKAAQAWLNDRQTLLLSKIANKRSRWGVRYTIKDIETMFSVTYATARSDLLWLVEKWFLQMSKSGNKLIFIAMKQEG